MRLLSLNHEFNRSELILPESAYQYTQFIIQLLDAEYVQLHNGARKEFECQRTSLTGWL